MQKKQEIQAKSETRERSEQINALTHTLQESQSELASLVAKYD